MKVKEEEIIIIIKQKLRKAFPRINRRFMIPTTEGKCWDNKENRILNIKKENENKKEKQKTEIPNIKRFQELLNGWPVERELSGELTDR